MDLISKHFLRASKKQNFAVLRNTTLNIWVRIPHEKDAQESVMMPIYLVCKYNEL